ncbi:beta-lactamase [Penicillium capsulatum]|uniref:Beta-lactamase n=1 Tax=Penicillium capsulatum TaxID=69766 RepID=A0A9W9LZY2_9EURO|nr:beta-lactamase [Penicillium capsulatum]KAJ6130598.1 beta-lactamase [Penicillium capsulatum]
MADIETTFQASIDSGKIHGAVICATDAETRFVYNKALGERTLLSGKKQPQRLDDVLFLASATKLLATIAALQCVEDGLLTLDSDLSSIAPELAAKHVLTGFAEDGTPLLEPPVRPITLKMLLTHSSGLCYHVFNPHLARWCEQFAPAQGNKRKTVFQPGENWMYGPGLDWAGRIVERVTGRTLGEHMQERIFNPLGIADGQFYPATREDLRPRLVDLNPDDPEALGLAVIGDNGETNRQTLGDFGGHGLFLPGCDYGKILHSILANDEKILKPATVENMFQHHLNPQATAGYNEVLAGPIGMFFRVGTSVDMKLGHGLGGVLTLEDADGWYGERTLSWGGGLTHAWFIDRKNDLCGFGGVLAALPVDCGEVTTLKQTFREDIYRKHRAWKEKQ